MVKKAHRKLAAILVADVVGYSLLMGEDEAGTLDTLKTHREELIGPKIAEHEGRIVKLMGDGLLAEFPSAVEAVQCAADIQRSLGERNAQVPEEKRIRYRIGINIGDVIVEGDDIYGDGVNIAARLESLAKPGGIYISSDVHRQVDGKLDVTFDDLGEHELKNITKPVRVYRLREGRHEYGVPSGLPMRRSVLLPLVAAFFLLVAGVVVWKLTDQPDPISREDVQADSALPGDPVLAVSTVPSVAVMPFINMSGDEAQEYFADGITEEIITELSRFHELRVVARHSTFQYKGTTFDVRDIGQALDVRYILEGSVRRAEDMVRVSAQLIDASDGTHLWAETYDRDLTLENILTVQRNIAQQVAGIVATSHGVIARAALGEAQRSGTDSLDTYDCVLRFYAYRRVFTSEQHVEVRDCLEKAGETDPNYSEVWAGLAFVYQDEYRYEYNPRPEPLARALKAARRAVELDSASQRAHWALARTHFWRQDLDAFMAEAEKTIALNPNNATAIGGIGLYMTYIGEMERGVALVRKAAVLNPNHPGWFHFALFWDHYERRNYNAALAEAQKIGMPDFFWTYIVLAAAYGQLGKEEEAAAAVDKLLELYPTFLDKAERVFRMWNFSGEFLAHAMEGLHKAGIRE